MRGKCLPLLFLLACDASPRAEPHPPTHAGAAGTSEAQAAAGPVDPDADRDADGFLDLQDACADEPGHEPDGCPARDGDADQIFDVDDDCPDRAELVNRYRDHDGCPDEFPAGWALLDEPLFFGLTVEELRSRPTDELTPAMVERLKKVAALLRAYPELTIEIVGHHDAAWTLRRKQNPGARRVLAARKFLVEREKIKARRIHFRTEGTDRPMVDNDTPEGPLKNNRLEFVILPN